jgi:hypothetical protein
MTFLEAVKQLQSLVPAVLPYVTAAKLPLFRFLNPSIAQDLWPLTSILALLVSAVNFNLAKSRNKRTLALNLCFIGLALALFSFLLLNAIVSKLLLDSYPSLQDYAVQTTFVLIFVGIGLASGWIFAKMLG